MSKVTKLSLWFATCVSFGLLFAYVDGISAIGLAKAALLASTIIVTALLCVSAWQKIKQKKI